MDKSEALRSIRYDLLEYIQKKVKVDFDNAGQVPVSFTFGGKTYVVGEVLGRFRTREEHPLNAFLVNASSGEVYFLYFHLFDLNRHGTVREGCWVLRFRILNDHELMAFYREDRKMLLNMALKRVVDFHGHLCPDLVLGCKLCEYVQRLIAENGELAGGMSIIAENCTSALDAIQILMGSTVGNQRLLVMDFGKHNYTILSKKVKNGFKLSLKRQHYCDEDAYNSLEQKITSRQVVLEDAVQFQKLLDNRVRHLLSLSSEDIFVVEPIESAQPPVESVNVFLVCGRCGEQVIKGREVEYQGEIYCMPCFQRINTGCRHYNMH
jgi:formylmethanofuran dehydrogenase subunit E